MRARSRTKPSRWTTTRSAFNGSPMKRDGRVVLGPFLAQPRRWLANVAMRGEPVRHKRATAYVERKRLPLSALAQPTRAVIRSQGDDIRVMSCVSQESRPIRVALSCGSCVRGRHAQRRKTPPATAR